MHATGPGDVVKAGSEDEALGVLAAFRARGLSGAIVQEHLAGPVVKFYAVGTAFFHHLVTSGPADAEIDLALLRRRARQCGDALGLDVFGGECVVTADGALPVIDVNDWPSFAPLPRRGRAGDREPRPRESTGGRVSPRALVRTAVPGPRSLALFESEQGDIAPGIQSIALLSKIAVARGEGAVVEDLDGNRFIDFSAGVAVASLGHAHPRFVEAVSAQAARGSPSAASRASPAPS